MTTVTVPREPAPQHSAPHSLLRSTYPALVGRAMLLAAQMRVRMWDRALVDVKATQERELMRIVRHSQDTRFGRAHDFRRIRSYEDFRAYVKVGDYDSFSPYIDQMRQGMKNLLVPEVVRYYGNSS